MFHAEALLFVHQDQAQIAVDHILREEAVGSDRDIDFAFGQIGEPGLYFLGSTEAAEHFDPHGEGLKAALEGLEVLKGEHGSGRQDDHLLAVAERFEGGAHDHFGLPVAHVAAQQAIHRLSALHIALDFGDGGQLVPRGRKFESVLELALPITIRRVVEPVGHFARGVELQQLVRHVAHFGFDFAFGARPGGPAHAVQRRAWPRRRRGSAAPGPCE